MGVSVAVKIEVLGEVFHQTLDGWRGGSWGWVEQTGRGEAAWTGAMPECYTLSMQLTNISVPPQPARPPIRVVRARRRRRPGAWLRFRIGLRSLLRLYARAVDLSITLVMVLYLGAVSLTGMVIVLGLLYLCFR